MRTLAILVLLSTSIAAQGPYQWRAYTGTTKPLARSRHAMVFDAARTQTVLFGGLSASGWFDDTWVYDGSGWLRKFPTHHPLARAGHALAYDPLREKVVLIGGTRSTPYDDIWEWDGNDWTQVASGIPGVGDGGAACFDPALGGVLYNLGTTNLLWNGTNAQVLSVAQPSGATNGDMVFDAGLGAAMTSSGYDTKVFRMPTGWTSLSPQHPFSLFDYALSIDPVLGRPVLQGGSGSVGNSSGNGFGQTWMWNGSNWASIAAFPGPWNGRFKHAMAFDLSRRVFVMFGGDTNNGPHFMDDTWELFASEPTARFGSFGAGCGGINATAPQLGPETTLNTVPVLGGTFTLRADDVPVSQPAWLLLGFSDALFGGVALPLALDPFGMPQCALLVAPDILEAMGTAGATGRVWKTLSVPGGVEFAGAEFYVQCVALAPGANAAGALWSNGGRGVIGYRP